MNTAKPNPIGHRQSFALLERAFRNDRLAHAYLITGPQDVGKADLAACLARLVLATEQALEANPDYIHIERGADPKTGKERAIIALDQIHEVRGKLSRRPLLGGWQVAIIKDAHLLNSSAANGLLKTLEEPRPQTLLILTATSTEAVMPTIQSRCQEMKLNRVPRADIEQALIERGVLKTQAGLLARLADGCPLRAQRLADQPEELDRLRELREQALSLSSADYATRWRVIEDLLPKKHAFQEAGARAQSFLDITAELLRDALLIQNGQEQRIVHVDAIDGVRRLAATTPNLAVTLTELYRARQLVNENVSPRNALQNFVLAF